MVGLGSSSGNGPKGVCGLATGESVVQEALWARADWQQEVLKTQKLVPSKKKAKWHLGTHLGGSR